VHCSSLTSVCVQLHTTCLPWCFCPIADTPLQIWLFWPWRRRKSLKLTRSSDIGNCIQWMDVWCCAPFVQTYIIIPENSTAASHQLFLQECNLNLRPHFSLRKIDSNRFTVFSFWPNPSCGCPRSKVNDKLEGTPVQLRIPRWWTSALKSREASSLTNQIISNHIESSALFLRLHSCLLPTLLQPGKPGKLVQIPENQVKSLCTSVRCSELSA